MKTKSILLSMLAILPSVKAQITPSFSIPNPIPQYDGTYENFGQGHLFYPNAGEVRFMDESQTDASDAVQYYTMNTHPKLYLLTNNNLSMCYAKNHFNTGVTSTDSLHRIDLEWQGSNGGAFLARVDTQKFARLHYFTQWFGSSGLTDVAGGAAIACQSVYTNIDLVYTSNQAGLVMYFIVYPGGDFNDITLHLGGSKANSIAGNKLKVEANWEYTTFEKPNMYQYVINTNVVTPVTVCNAFWSNTAPDTYKITNNLSFNSALPLIIQIKQGNPVNYNVPGLCWSTYFGGFQFDYLSRTHTDANDNFYVAGSSSSINGFPQGQGPVQTSQAIEGVISKFNSAGQLQWSVFVGGEGNDEIRDFAFNGNKIYCVGKTSSTSNFPLKTKATPAFNDATFGGGSGAYDGFIFEFELVAGPSVKSNWLTYFGGNGEDDLYACAADVSGNLYVAGASSSSDLSPVVLTGGYSQIYNTSQAAGPSLPLATDAIIGKFNANGSQSWFTYFGTDALGTNAHNHAGDYFYGLTVTANDIYACGKSGGTNLPNSLNSKIVPGNFDGILAHFSTSGALNHTKYTDGNIVNFAVEEKAGKIYTVGEADGSMNAVNSGLYYYTGTVSGNKDACFSVHTSNLSSTIHNSFLGGSTEDIADDIAFTSGSHFYISGGTNSSDFPVTSLGSMYTANAQGGKDNFIVCMDIGNTNLVWSSYLGTAFNESMDFPVYIHPAIHIQNTTISVDSKNRLRMLASSTSPNTFPLDAGNGIPYFQNVNSGQFMANDATITCFEVSDITGAVGMEDFKNTEFLFGLYPNPTTKSLSITNTTLVKDDLRYAIYDAEGRKLLSGNLSARDVKVIDVSTLPQGIYVVNASNGVKTFSNKFIKTDD